MRRDVALERCAARRDPYDLIVIGGGATGAGIAWDAASRGLATLLLERGDFGQGTSSRSTKLIHGGVRYLAQGRLGLVREALRERTLLLRNAPDICRPRAFLIPVGRMFERCKYRLGLSCYDLLARGSGLPGSRFVSKAELAQAVPELASRGLQGGIRYFDGQFDDMRLLLAVLASADALGATVLNYAEATGFAKRQNGRICGVEFVDRESGAARTAAGRIVVNATGPSVDRLCAADRPGVTPQVSLSRGSHIVVDRAFLAGEIAILIPQAPDGRVMFAIPWHDRVLIGTTDVPVAEPAAEPRPAAEEIDLLLEVAAHTLRRPPSRRDIRAAFAGIRPLAAGASGMSTARVSREHRLHQAASGLITIVGGKWTTFRRMAEDCVDFALRTHRLAAGPSRTAILPLAPAPPGGEMTAPDSPALCAGLPYRIADCIRAVRGEMACHVEDVLARRTRALFLDAPAALAAAPAVASMMAAELERDERWASAEVAAFQRTAAAYIVTP